MPEMDGFQLTKQIKLIEEHWYNQMRQSRSFRATKAKYFCPIIAVTSYTAREVYEEASAAGIIKVIHKPVSFSMLRDIVREFHLNKYPETLSSCSSIDEHC